MSKAGTILCILLLAGFALAGQTKNVAKATTDAISAPTLINYQGKLTDATGTPISGTKHFIFSIYDDLTAGTLIWGPEDWPTVTVTQGVFNVVLGTNTTGGVVIPDGPNCFLEITVEGVVIAPRVRLVSAPYAMKAADAADAEMLGGLAPSAYERVANKGAASGYAGLNASSKLTLGTIDQGGATSGQLMSWNGSTWTPATVTSSNFFTNSGSGYIYPNTPSNNTNARMYGSGYSYSVYGASYTSSGYFGVYGYNSSSYSYGVGGYNAAYYAAGVYGYNASYYGYGVYGYNSSYYSAGVAGNNAAYYSYGVYGYNSGYYSYGVYGYTSGYYGSAVYGYGSGYYNYGVYGYNGYWGNFGILGTGYYSPFTYPCGVYGYAYSSYGYGVYGYNGSSYAYGVFGVSSSYGYGVYGYNIGSYGYGVYGYAGSYGTGVYGNGYYCGVAGYNQYYAYYAYLSYQSYKVYGTGTVSTYIQDANGDERVLHCPETPEVLFEDVGTNQLANGYRRVNIDPLLLRGIVIDAENPLRVFVTATGTEPVALAVQKGDTYFEVYGPSGSNANFDWRLVANRKGFQNLRFENRGRPKELKGVFDKTPVQVEPQIQKTAYNQ